MGSYVKQFDDSIAGIYELGRETDSHVVAVKAIEFAKSNQVKTSLGPSDQIVVQIFENTLRKITGDGLDLLFCNSDEARIFTKTHSTEVEAELLQKYARTFIINRDAGGSLHCDGKALVQILSMTANAVDTKCAGPHNE